MFKIIMPLLCTALLFTTGCVKSCQKRADVDTEVLRIGTNATYVPFESIDATGKLVGFDIDFGRALGEALGKKVEFKEFDFDALILALDKEHVDLVLSALSITADRQKQIAMVPYSGEPIKTIALLFWKNEPSIKNTADLKASLEKSGSTINVQAGHFLEGFLKSAGVATKTLSGPPEQILDLKYEKSLAAAVDPKNARKLLKMHPELKLSILDLPEDAWDLGYGVGVKKSRQKLIEEVSAAISKLRADGTLATLEKKWLEEAP